jgi:hypothetical protein
MECQTESQVLPIPVGIGACVVCGEWNWQRALQEVTEEWELWGLCMTKRSGPRAVCLLVRKLTNNFWAGVQSQGAVAPNPMPKRTVSMMGSLTESIIVIVSYRRQ